MRFILENLSDNMQNDNYLDWSKDDLVKEIKKLKKRKKYGIVWDEEKTKEKFEEDSENKLPILKEAKSKEIQTDNNSPTNILIEGDNYHSLSVLNYTHARKVDVIYIDPPYNIGKEFRYNDKFIDLEDRYRHSKWLSFMKNRLILAKTLLKKSGVIFISIDDNEQAPLKLLCDEVFGGENFVASLVWQKKYSPQNDAKYLSDMHDFIHVYAKSKNITNTNGWKRNLFPRSEEMNARYKNYDDDPRGVWKMSDMSVKTYNKNYDYPIKVPSGRIVNPPPGRCWRISKEKYKKLLADNRVWFGKSENNVPAVKKFLTEVQDGVVPVTWWTKEFAGHNQDAKKELDEFKLKFSFETPKPKKLLKRIFQLSTNKNSIILDFFAGSGTTGHAVLELNDEDGGNRKFILCTNNENEICSEICYPRIKKVIQGYSNLKNKKIEGLRGNLKYFKTDFVDGEPTDKNKKKLVDQCTEMLCLKDDCFDEIKQTKTYSIFKNHEEKYLGIIYDDDGIEPFKKQIKSTGKKFNVYVFSLDDSAREEEFEDVKNMVDLKPIPEVILNVYRRILR